MQITLKAARVNAGFTQSEVANIARSTTKTISNWENGVSAIPTDKFYLLCNVYGLNQDFVKIPTVRDGEFE